MLLIEKNDIYFIWLTILKYIIFS